LEFKVQETYNEFFKCNVLSYDEGKGREKPESIGISIPDKSAILMGLMCLDSARPSR
jgi:hypothetical protein